MIEGMLIIAGLAFIISMLVATIIWLLSLFIANDNNQNEEKEHSSIHDRIKSELKQFESFQKQYRTYWDGKNAPTNELIAFFHEQ